jgi:hypothetical protein
MRRLESTLRRNIITKDLWQTESGYIYRIGEARILFLSGAPESNIVGATASLLLEVDEAQDVLAAKYEREIAPMASSRNSTRVFWGTAWTAETLLARELAAARKSEQESCQSGNLLARRAFCINAEIVAAEVPAYGRFVQEQVRKLGRQHPMIRTQYFCEEFGGENQLFHEDRIKSMQSDHPPRTAPQASDWIVILADVAGADETSGKTFGKLRLSIAVMRQLSQYAVSPIRMQSPNLHAQILFSRFGQFFNASSGQIYRSANNMYA